MLINYSITQNMIVENLQCLDSFVCVSEKMHIAYYLLTRRRSFNNRFLYQVFLIREVIAAILTRQQAK